MFEPLDFYAVLGVDHRASQSEIRSAYRREAKRHHPDVGGDPEAFRRVQLAWEALGDPGSRAEYDSELVGFRLAAARGAYSAGGGRSAYSAPPRAAGSGAEGSTTSSSPSAHRIPLWFWVVFAPLALLAVVYPPAQLLVVPAAAVLGAVVVAVMRRRLRSRGPSS